MAKKIKKKNTKRKKKSMSEKSMFTEDGERVSIEEVVAAQSLMIKDLLEAYHLAGKAINRLESYTFSLVKVILDNNLTGYDDLLNSCTALMQSDSLEEFWGIESSDKDDSSEEQPAVELQEE